MVLTALIGKAIRRAVVPLSLCVSLVVAGCSTAIRIHFFNNTDDAVTIRYRSALGIREKEIPALASHDFESAWFHIVRGDCVLEYQFEGVPPSDYVESSGLRRHVKVQLEGDWSIVLLRSEDDSPIRVEGYAQPSGYPLSARSNCGS